MADSNTYTLQEPLVIVPEGAYVIPDWAQDLWSVENCSVEKTTEGGYIVLDHNLCTVVFEGTRNACNKVLSPSHYAEEDFGIENYGDDFGTGNSDWVPWDLGESSCYSDEDLFLGSDAGAMVRCPHCGIDYWSEDGHPEGTLCPKFGIDVQPKADFAGKKNPGIITCPIHKVEYWWEDGCPKCDEM